jgi:hypothetical protein
MQQRILTHMQFFLPRRWFGAVGDTRSAKRRSTLGKTKIPGHSHNSRGFVRAHAHSHTGACGRMREALDIRDLEAPVLLNLYKIAHYELAVDKWDNFALAILESGHF